MDERLNILALMAQSGSRDALGELVVAVQDRVHHLAKLAKLV